MIRIITLGVALSLSPMAGSVTINQKIATAYNEGLVRCSNAECAKYLYACFRSYSSSSLQDFLACGSQASRLNNDQLVVANP